jgi:hypothetical protein
MGEIVTGYVCTTDIVLVAASCSMLVAASWYYILFRINEQFASMPPDPACDEAGY